MLDTEDNSIVCREKKGCRTLIANVLKQSQDPSRTAKGKVEVIALSQPWILPPLCISVPVATQQRENSDFTDFTNYCHPSFLCCSKSQLTSPSLFPLILFCPPCIIPILLCFCVLLQRHILILNLYSFPAVAARPPHC